MFAGITLSLFLLSIGGIFFSALFLWLAARMAGIGRATYGQALVSTFISGIICLVANSMLAFIPILGHVMAFFISFLISAAVTSAIFSCSYGQALGAEMIRWFISVAVGVMIFVGSCGALLSSLSNSVNIITHGLRV